MEQAQTRYGAILTASPVERFQDGTVKSCQPCAYGALTTPAGVLVPQFSTDDARRKTVSPVAFYPDGALRAISLETRSPISTPLGSIPAEFVTFHPSGALHRVFPLNGRLTAYWGEEDEASLAEPMTIATPVGDVTARMLCLRFDQKGRLAGLTLWPGESVTVKTPCGLVAARIGLAFYPDGALRSLEPARPAPVNTPIGTLLAFDPDAVGVSGDENSLMFSPEGALTGVSTIQNSVSARLADGTRHDLRPAMRESLCGNAEREPVPMALRFYADRLEAVRVPGEAPLVLPLAGTAFTARRLVFDLSAMTPLSCSH